MSSKAPGGNNKTDLRSSFHSSKYSGHGNRRQHPSRDGNAYGPNTNSHAPKLQVGGVKMRERKKGPNPLRVISQNKIKESNQYEQEEKNLRNFPKRKISKRAPRAGSLVRRNTREKGNQLLDSYNNGPQNGRNNAAVVNDDFSNSFIEGKSFSNNPKLPSFIEKPQSKGKVLEGSGDSDTNEVARKIQDLDANSKILDFQNKNISAPSIGPYPIGSNNNDPTVTMRSISEANEDIDK